MEQHKIINIAVMMMDYNDVNVMLWERVVWNFWWFILMSDPWYMGGKCDNEEWYLSWEHLFPRGLGYKRRTDIKGVDIMEFKSNTNQQGIVALLSNYMMVSFERKSMQLESFDDL